MVSRLLSALDARIAKTRDPLQHACLSAERATLLARQGRLDEARTELDRIRARYAAKPDAVVTAWVCLGEGMVIYFNDLGPGARDRIQRAVALSKAANATPLAALSSAWLAQMDFARLDFAPLLQHLLFALRNAETSQHSARSRASLVVAQSFHWAERLDLGLPWYGRARQHATAEGDESMLSALMHNMAWLRVAHLRRCDVAGELNSAEARQAQLGADSIQQFDGIAGIASLSSLVPVLRAQVMMLRGDFDQALNLLEANLEGFLEKDLGRMGCTLHADLAWCRFRLGDTSGAIAEARLATSLIAPTTHADDLAMTYSRTGRIYGDLGDAATANQHLRQAQAAWRVHAQQQAKLVSELQPAVSDL